MIDTLGVVRFTLIFVFPSTHAFHTETRRRDTAGVRVRVFWFLFPLLFKL